MDANKPQSPASKKAAQQSRRVSLGEYRAVVADLLTAAEKRASDVEMAQRAAEAMLSSIITGDQRDQFLAALATLSDTTKDLLKKHADEVTALKANLSTLDLTGDLASVNDGSTEVGEVSVDTSGIEEALRTMSASLGDHLARLTEFTTTAMQQWTAAVQQMNVERKKERRSLFPALTNLRTYLKDMRGSMLQRLDALQERVRDLTPRNVLSAMKEKVSAGKEKAHELLSSAATYAREKKARAVDRTKEILERLSLMSQATKERLGKVFGLRWLRKRREKEEEGEKGPGLLRTLLEKLKGLSKADSMGGGLGMLLAGGALIGALSSGFQALLENVPGFKTLVDSLEKLPANVRGAVEWANEKLQPVLKVIKEAYGTLETKGAELREFLDRYFQRFADALGIKAPPKAPDENRNAGYAGRDALPPVPKSFVSPTREQTAAELERFRNSAEQGPGFRGPVMPLMRGANGQEVPDNYRPVVDRNGVVRFISPEGNYAKDRQGNPLSGNRNDEVIQRRMAPDAQQKDKPQPTSSPSGSGPVQAPAYGGATVQRHGFDPMSIPNALTVDPVLGALIYGGQ